MTSDRQPSMLGLRVCAGLVVCFLSLILACGNDLWSDPDHYVDLAIPSCDSIALVKETLTDRQATGFGLSSFYGRYESPMGGSVVELNERVCEGKDLILRMAIYAWDSPDFLGRHSGEGDLFQPVTPSEIPIFVSNRGHKFFVYESGDLDCGRLPMEGRGDGCVTYLKLWVQLGRYELLYEVERAEPPWCGEGETDWCVGLDAFEMLWKTLDRTMSAYIYYGLTG